MKSKHLYSCRTNWLKPMAALAAAACLCCHAEAKSAGLSFPHTHAINEAVPAVATTLSYTLGKTGMISLSNNGVAFFTSPNNGAVTLIDQPLFQLADGSGYYYGSKVPISTSLNPMTNTVTAIYDWGSLACQYTQSGNTLKMRFTATNTTNDLMTTVSVKLPEMTFPITPTGRMVDSSGYTDEAPPQPLYYSNFWADPRYRPGVLLIDYGTGAVAVCDEETTSMARIIDSGSNNAPARTRYPLRVGMQPVQGGDSQTCTVSLRFTEAGSAIPDVANDLIQEYSALFPAQLDWDDRRAIGALFLANHGGGAAYALNPRGWFGDPYLDLTTPAGYPLFRQRLMDYADEAVGHLHDMNAQGILVWDLEGEQYPQSTTYIGDPRLLSRLAPEMEYVDSSGVATVDAFFQKFRNAGLTLGLLLRPQQITFDTSGTPHQSDFTQPGKTLGDKITYAKNRWGAKIFHLDTDAGAGPSDSDIYPSFDRGNGALDPGIMQQLANANPDILMIPEWKTSRYYAYTAAFGSIDLAEGTVTSSLVHAVYPGGFLCNLDRSGDHGGTLRSLLIPGLANGDALMYNGWFDDEPANGSIMSMYAQAGTPPVARLTLPSNGATFRAGSRVTLQAVALAASGKSISKVEFFETTTTGGRVKIGQATTAPYTVVWNTVPAGAYVLSVTATDNKGLTRTPSTQTIISGPVSYNFTDKSADDAALTGPHAGIDFGTGKWRYNNAPTNAHGQMAYFDYTASGATGRTFTLPVGRFLRSVTLISHSGDTYAISDGANPPITGTLSANVPVAINTNWRGGGNKITLTFPQGSSSGLSSISY